MKPGLNSTISRLLPKALHCQKLYLLRLRRVVLGAIVDCINCSTLSVFLVGMDPWYHSFRVTNMMNKRKTTAKKMAQRRLENCDL
jgi:hypothetical protein